LTGLLGWVSGGAVSIRDLSLKELRALAQLRLGTKAAELKTRQELVDAIEKTGPKRPPRLIVPLAGPLPEPPPVELIGLPPEPAIWTGDAPLPQITARPALPEFPAERLVWSAQVLVEGRPGGSATAEPPQVAARREAAPTAAPPTAAPPTAAPPTAAPPTAAPLIEAAQIEGARFSTEIAQPETVTRHFFLAPDQPRLPVAYEDDRVLTFARDPKTIYAAWDFSPARFEEGNARGRVVDFKGITLQSFAVEGPSGSTFIDALPPGVPVRVEVLGGDALIGHSRWVKVPFDRPALNAPSSVV
jgi:hypothetical protein